MLYPATSTTGDAIDLPSCSVAYTYNMDDTLHYQTVTALDGTSYRKTYTYANALVVTESGWVKQ